MDLTKQRIVVTGGAGFLGRFLQAELAAAGVDSANILVPLIEDYDLTQRGDVERMYADMAPTVVIHLGNGLAGRAVFLFRLG